MNKRIAYITASADTLYATEIIKAMSRQAYALGYDLVVLTHFVNYTDGGSYIKGDENIYSLIGSLPLDGAVMDYNSYFSKGLADHIEELLASRNIPVIALDYQSTRFESCIQQDRENFRKLTEHFIQVHGLRKIYCLTGPENDIHSVERANGYKDALRANGIAVRNKNIFYGDFWIYSPQSLAEDILSGRTEKPEAVVCGNDYMAYQLCLSLSKGGISVPSEIAVGGFDGNSDVLRYHPSITTFAGGNLENAVNAVSRIHEMITGDNSENKIRVETRIRIGASCGCRIDVSQAADNSQKNFDSNFNGNIYLHSSYSSIINKAFTLEQLSLALTQNMYLIDRNSDFFFCLCSDWEGSSDEPDNYRSNGYSQEMQCIMSSLRMNCECTFRSFSLGNILPDVYLSNEPMTYILTPLHCLERCFGYCVRRYDSEIVFEEYYGEFCQIAANAVEKIRMLRYENKLRENIRKLSERDMLTGLYSRLGLENRLRDSDSSKSYFGVLYYLCNTSADDDTSANETIVFSQAVNFSAAGMIAARTSANEFIVVGECYGSAHPEQLFINTLNNNLKSIEKQQNISILSQLVHFSSVTGNGSAPAELLSLLEAKLESYKCSGSEKNSVYLSQIRKLQYELYEEPQLDWNSETEAKRIGVSQSYFQHLYKQFHNTSFKSDVISARIALAEKLLLNTALNVSEIAERCGYPDTSHFMKLFRSKTGKTALKFRKTH